MRSSFGRATHQEEYQAVSTNASFSDKKIVVIHNTTKYLHLHYEPLIEELVKRGADVVVIAPIDQAGPKLEQLGVKCVDIGVSRYGINPVVEIGTIHEIYRQLIDLRPDIVFNFSIKPVIYGSIAARLAGCTNVYSMITGLGHLFMEGSVKYALLRGFIGHLYRFALRANARVFFQNPEDNQLFQKMRLVDEQQGVTLNGTGIDLEKFQPDGTAPAGGTFILASRLLWSKGIREYVDAARDLKKTYPDADFQILGSFDDNPSSVDLEDIAAWQEEAAVTYLGETSDVRPYLNKAAVFVLPTKYREGLPRSILEAMALGKPVIATDVPGCRDAVVENENGFLVQVGNVESLKNAMARFLVDPSLVARMGRASRRMAESRYSVKKVNDHILSEISGTANR